MWSRFSSHNLTRTTCNRLNAKADMKIQLYPIKPYLKRLANIFFFKKHSSHHLFVFENIGLFVNMLTCNFIIFMNYFIIFKEFSFFFRFYWDIIDIQHCINLRCTAWFDVHTSWNVYHDKFNEYPSSPMGLPS